MAKTGLQALAMTGLLLGSCAEAGANGNNTEKAEMIRTAAVTETVRDTKARTMEECRVLSDRVEKKACMREARAASDAVREIEIAALDNTERRVDSEIAARTTRIADKQDENAELDDKIDQGLTTNEVLSIVRDVSREAAAAENSSS